MKRSCPLFKIGNTTGVNWECEGEICMFWYKGECCMKLFFLGIIATKDGKPSDKEVV